MASFLEDFGDPRQHAAAMLNPLGGPSTYWGIKAAQGLSGGSDGEDKPNIPSFAELRAAREKDLQSGYAAGQKEFYDDPNMQSMLARREDLAKGYDGKTLGALREQSRSDVAGQQSKYLSQLSSNLGKAGVGGARAAAMKSAANVGFAGKRAENERAINIDQADQIRKGTDSLQDFVFRQKFGKLGQGIAEAQMGVADRTGSMQMTAAMFQPKKGILGETLGGLF